MPLHQQPAIFKSKDVVSKHHDGLVWLKDMTDENCGAFCCECHMKHFRSLLSQDNFAVKVGNFVALWTGQNDKFQLAKVVKPIQKAKLGEVINRQPTNHGQYHVVETESGDQVQQGASETDLYKFDTSTLCAKECAVYV